MPYYDSLFLSYQNTPLHTAILHKHGWLAQLLINHDPPLKAMDISGVCHANAFFMSPLIFRPNFAHRVC